LAATLAFGVGRTRAAGITYTDLYTLGNPSGITSITPNSAAGGLVAGYGPGTNAYVHAVLWSSTSSTGADLMPAGATYSNIEATDGSQQVGYAGTDAIAWTGNAGSAVNLTPSGFAFSGAEAVRNGQQVGEGGPGTGFHKHALLWSGSAASYVDLNPANVSDSIAYGTSGTQQVGWAFGTATGNATHAALWSGSAASFVDLNPANYFTSTAVGAGGGQQVGNGVANGPGSNEHALLWSGSAASSVDLNPANLTISRATDTNGFQQVGYGYTVTQNGSASTDGPRHALLWSGSAASVFDLQSVLPDTFGSSQASTISGNTVYGWAYDTTGNLHAIAWSIPEPASLSLLAIAALLTFHRRRAA
jgi:hypothetical protein